METDDCSDPSSFFEDDRYSFSSAGEDSYIDESDEEKQTPNNEGKD